MILVFNKILSHYRFYFQNRKKGESLKSISTYQNLVVCALLAHPKCRTILTQKSFDAVAFKIVNDFYDLISHQTIMPSLCMSRRKISRKMYGIFYGFLNRG